MRNLIKYNVELIILADFFVFADTYGALHNVPIGYALNEVPGLEVT